MAKNDHVLNIADAINIDERNPRLNLADGRGLLELRPLDNKKRQIFLPRRTLEEAAIAYPGKHIRVLTGDMQDVGQCRSCNGRLILGYEKGGARPIAGKLATVILEGRISPQQALIK